MAVERNDPVDPAIPPFSPIAQSVYRCCVCLVERVNRPDSLVTARRGRLDRHHYSCLVQARNCGSSLNVFFVVQMATSPCTNKRRYVTLDDNCEIMIETNKFLVPAEIGVVPDTVRAEIHVVPDTDPTEPGTTPESGYAQCSVKNIHHLFRLGTLDFTEDCRAEVFKVTTSFFNYSLNGFAKFAHAAYKSVCVMLQVDISALTIRIPLPGMPSVMMTDLLHSEDAVLRLFKGLFDLGSGPGKSPFAWQAHASQRQVHRQSWHFVLPYALLWPLIGHRVRVSEWKRPRTDDGKSQDTRRAHTYTISLDFVDEKMPADKCVKITPFNPLASVRCSGQQSRGDGAIADMFTSLRTLRMDVQCECGAKHGLPDHWLEELALLQSNEK